MEDDPRATAIAMSQLYSDAEDLYARAGEEVRIERSDHVRQKFLPGPYLDQLERGNRDEMLVPMVASMLRNRNRGSGMEHLSRARRLDLCARDARPR